jgi:uncharacterized protein YdhG (YjbR/CyaY superfamily)
MDSEGSRRQFKNIDDYIDTFPKNVQHKLTELRSAIKESAAEAEEAISYGMPTFRLNGNLVWFAAYKKHIGFYPTHSGILAFEEKLSIYKHSKGAVQFPIAFEEKPFTKGSRGTHHFRKATLPRP